MPNETQALDQVLEEMYAGGGAGAMSAEALALADFCQYWPYIRKFLEWAKSQTSNVVAKFIIDALIKLGNNKCGQ
jgi:hypothetical protein